MLVLTRKLGEAVVIDGSIRVQVVAIRGNHVKLGFVAPDSVGIAREELTGEWPRPAICPVDEPTGSDLAAAT